MIGLVLVGLSWILLRIESKGLAELGFDAPRRRAREMALGLALAGAFAGAQQLSLAALVGFSWTTNPEMTFAVALEGLRWNVNSVLFEELVFRGYLLYRAIRRLGSRRACLLSAAAFGVYHWFSFGVLGDPLAMAWVFVLTSVFGLMLAAAFAATRSLALPVGLHLGWNLVTILVFSNGPIGPQLLVAASLEDAAPPGAGPTLLVNVALPLALPLVVLWGLRLRGRRMPAP